jgi:hypothetical protein
VSPDERIPDEDVEALAIAAGEAVLSPADEETERSVRAQIETMHHRDRVMAWVFIVALLVVVPFVLIAVWNAMPNAGTRIVLVAAAAVVLLYNVASMLALLGNYARDRDFIYRRDVAHLRERAALRSLKAKR